MANKRITDLNLISGDPESGDFLLSTQITNTGNSSFKFEKKNFDEQLIEKSSGDIFGTQITEISGDLDSLDSRISANDGDISALNTASGVLDGEISSHESRMSDLGNTGTNLETQYSDINDAVGDLNTATGNLENRADALEVSTGLLDTATGSLQSRNTTEQGEISALNTTWSNINEGLTILETKSGELKDAIDFLREKVPDAESPLLQTHPGAAAAYSLRSLNTGESPVIRARRESDNQERDFTAEEVEDYLFAWSQGLTTPMSYDSSRDVGYFGEVSSSDLISGDDLATELSLTAGTAQNSDAGWLKFYVGPNAFCNRQGNAYILYVAKRTMRYNLSWNDINSAGGVDGTTEVEIDGQSYSVRLMQGADADPSTYSFGTNCSQNAGGNSEWNDPKTALTGRTLRIPNSMCK